MVSCNLSKGMGRKLGTLTLCYDPQGSVGARIKLVGNTVRPEALWKTGATAHTRRQRVYGTLIQDNGDCAGMNNGQGIALTA